MKISGEWVVKYTIIGGKYTNICVKFTIISCDILFKNKRSRIVDPPKFEFLIQNLNLNDHQGLIDCKISV